MEAIFRDVGDTTLIFIDYNNFISVLKNDGYRLINFRFELDQLYEGCFNMAFQEATFEDASIIFSTLGNVDSVDIFYNEPNRITAMVIVSFYREDRYADIWSVCASINGQSRGHARTILKSIQEGIQNVSVIDLYVDYDNPYWNRAVGLYTSIGFVNPTND